MVVIAAINSVSDLSPNFGQRSFTSGIGWPGIGVEHLTKANARKPASTKKIAASILKRNFSRSNGFIPDKAGECFLMSRCHVVVYLIPARSYDC